MGSLESDAMPRQRAWQEGDPCYQTGLHWRSLIYLVRPQKGVAGHFLKEIKIQFKEDKILIILKKDSPKGPMVAFIEARRFGEVVWVMAHLIKSKQLRWRLDEWEMRRVAK